MEAGGWEIPKQKFPEGCKKINPGLERGQLESHSLGLHIRDNREPV